MKKLIIVVFAFASFIGKSQTIDALSKERVEAQETPGIAVGVLENGERHYYYYGVADIASKEPVSAKTLFEIGSITKTFTCSILSYLARKQTLGLNDNAQNYLPSSIILPKKDNKSITLLNLATAHSGLPRMPGNFNPADQANPYIDYTEKELTAFLNNCELKYQPGSTYEYSNLGMGLLGFLTTQVVNKPYGELVKEVVLTPIGMKQTFISGESSSKWLATGYRDTSPVKAWTWNSRSVLTGAGGIVSNAEDMLTYLNAELSDEKSLLLDAMKDSQKERAEAGSPHMQIGLGWHIRDHRYLWHNGGTGGFRSFAGFDPKTKRAIVILTNSTTGADDLGFHWLNDSIPLKTIRKPIKLEPTAAQEYLGVYEINPTFKITITSKGSDMFLQATSQPVLNLYAESTDKFFLKVVEASVDFIRGSDHKIEKLILHQGGATLEGKKIN